MGVDRWALALTGRLPAPSQHRRLAGRILGSLTLDSSLELDVRSAHLTGVGAREHTSCGTISLRRGAGGQRLEAELTEIRSGRARLCQVVPLKVVVQVWQRSD